jgi:HSP20 family protein
MSRVHDLTHGLRDTYEHLADGWQSLVHKARHAITRFTPVARADESNQPVESGSWGLLSAEVNETGAAIEVQLEVPGMQAQDFEVDVDGRYLSVRGTKHYSQQTTEGRLHIAERAYGSFERLIPLPCEVDTGVANYRRGVLNISLPKRQQSRSRRIEVD